MLALSVPLLAACYAAGVLLAALAGGGRVAGLVLAAALLLLGLAVRRRLLLFLLALLGAALSAAWAAGSLALDPKIAECHVSRRTGGPEARVLATVLDDAVPLPGGAWRQELRAESLLEGRRATPLCGAIELRLGAGPAPLARGERLLIRGRLRPATGSRNPGAPSARLRRLSSSVGAVLYPEPANVVRLGRAPSPPLLSSMRARVRQAIERTRRPAAEQQVLGALILGDGALDPELRQVYARSGTSHLLAVSGLHLSLVAMGALGLLRRLLLRLGAGERCDPARLVALPAASLVIGYTLLTGAPASASRSCIMACAGFVGLLLQRPPDLVRPLSLAALGLLAYDPLNLFRAGFQLSFVAVIAIGLVLARDRERERDAGEPRPGPLRWARGLLLASVAATLLTAPICAHHFHQLSLAGVVANLLAVPLTSFALLPASLAGAALAGLDPRLGAPVLSLASWVAGRLTDLCALFAAAPGASLPVGLGWLAALGALALGLVVLLPRGRPRRLLAMLALLLLAIAALLALRRGLRDDLELAFLDVGQGDSTFVRFPDGFTLLVDGGGTLTGADPGASQVIPFLRGRGVRRLDLVVLSHPHPDHAGGLLSVLRGLPVGELWTCWHGEPDPFVAALLDEARRRGIAVRAPRPLERGGARLWPLWPQGYEGACADPGFSTNDNSLVLRLEHGRSSALLAGDIEADAERELLRGAAPLRADLIKVPHHGSARSSTAALLDAVAPRLALISCGAANRFGFPAPQVLARYAARRITVLRTDELGAIGVRLSTDGEVSWEPLAGAVP